MRRARVVALGVLALICIAVLPAPAYAHGFLERSDPTDGERLGQAPPTIRLWFSEPVRLPYSSFELRSAGGDAVALDDVATGADGSSLVVLSVPRLARGVYVLSWRVLSAYDTHITQGVVLFGVRADVSASIARPSPPGPAPAEILLRWLDVASVILLIGSLAVVRLVLERRNRTAKELELLRRPRRRGLAAAAAAAGAGLGLGLALLAWQLSELPRGSDVSWFEIASDFSFRGRWAVLWWARQLSLAAVLACVVALRRSVVGSTSTTVDRRQRRLWIAAGALVIALALLRATGGHAALSGPAAVVAEAVHLLAAGIWIGGLVAMTVAIGPMRGGDPIDRRLVLHTWLAFGKVAIVAVGTLAASGLLVASGQLSSFDDLVRTTYGRALTGKAWLFIGAGLFGMLNALTLRRRRIRPDGLARNSPARPILAVEVTLALAVLVMVGVMGSSAPPRTQGGAVASDDRAIASMSKEVGDLVVTLAITPNRPGVNVISASAVSSRRPAPAQISSVVLESRASGGTRSSSPMTPDGADRFSVTGDLLDRGGPWDLAVIVRRPGLDDVTARFGWIVRGALSTERQPDRQLSSFLILAAALVAVATIAAAISMASRASRSRPARVDESAATPPPLDRELVGAETRR